MTGESGREIEGTLAHLKTHAPDALLASARAIMLIRLWRFGLLSQCVFG